VPERGCAPSRVIVASLAPGIPMNVHLVWAKLLQGRWVLLAMLAFAGVTLGVMTGDHRLVNRSIAVLLVTYGLLTLLQFAG
jgi:hypothetical protein